MATDVRDTLHTFMIEAMDLTWNYFQIPMKKSRMIAGIGNEEVGEKDVVLPPPVMKSNL